MHTRACIDAPSHIRLVPQCIYILLVLIIYHVLIYTCAVCVEAVTEGNTSSSNTTVIGVVVALIVAAALVTIIIIVLMVIMRYSAYKSIGKNYSLPSSIVTIL